MNEAKILEELQKAAESGYAFNQFDLGLRYANGFGVEKDLAKAAEWLRKAAEQGVEGAQKALDEISADPK